MIVERKQNTRSLRRPIPIALCMLVAGIVLVHALEEGNGVKPGVFVVEPPTLISLGFEWYVDGDRNHTATVEVSYRKKTENVCKSALPLLRINKEESIFSFLNNRIDYLTAKGTPEKPIVIKAAGDGEVIFDGNGNWNLFNLLAADYHYFEGLTIRGTEIAFWAGHKKIAGSSGLTVKKCRFEDIRRGIYTDWGGSKNFYIADNVFIGRHNPNALHGWTNLPQNI
jgi:hypothetical protein